jgi:PAS domain S-box-containing protein
MTAVHNSTGSPKLPLVDPAWAATVSHEVVGRYAKQRGMIMRLLDSSREGNLHRLRLVFLAFAVANTVIVLAMALTAASSSMQHIAVLGSAAYLTVWWIIGFRRRRFLWAGDVLEAAAIAGLLLTIRDPEKAIGIFYATMFFRSLYGSVRRNLTRSCMFLAVLVVGVILTPSHEPLATRVVPHAVSFLFIGLVIHLVATTLHKHERALSRELVLRDLGIRLVGTHEDAAMHRAVVASLRALVEDDPTARVGIGIGNAEVIDVMGVAGHDVDAAMSGRFFPGKLPASEFTDLSEGRSIVRRDAREDGTQSFAAKHCQTFAPLLVGGRLAGMLALTTDRECPEDVGEAMATMGAQVSVWLDARAFDTAAQRSEAHFRALVQHASDIIAVMGADGVVSYVSPSITAILGYDPESLIGKVGFDFIHPDDLTPAVEMFFGSMRTTDTRPPLLARAVASDGATHWLELTLMNRIADETLRGVVVNARDVTERHANEAALVLKDRERARLLRHLVAAQEEERRIIAADIHDDSIQQMSAAAIRIGMLGKYIDDDAGQGILAKVEASVGDSIDRLRKLMFQLQPPALAHDGLAGALREQLAAVADEAGFRWDLSSDLASEPANALRINAFRMVQEALVNVRKHAGASFVAVSLLATDNGVYASVQDDGCGFDAEKFDRSERGHLGVTSMRERAELAGGWCKITSSPGSGARVEFWMPDEAVPSDSGDDMRSNPGPSDLPTSVPR